MLDSDTRSVFECNFLDPKDGLVAISASGLEVFPALSSTFLLFGNGGRINSGVYPQKRRRIALTAAANSPAVGRNKTIE